MHIISNKVRGTIAQGFGSGESRMATCRSETSGMIQSHYRVDMAETLDRG